MKLDRTFVNDIVTHEAGKIIASSMIFAAHKLGARPVAEGVETEEQRVMLAGMQCEHAQGYLIGATISAAAFGALIGAHPVVPSLGKVA